MPSPYRVVEVPHNQIQALNDQIERKKSLDRSINAIRIVAVSSMFGGLCVLLALAREQDWFPRIFNVLAVTGTFLMIGRLGLTLANWLEAGFDEMREPSASRIPLNPKHFYNTPPIRLFGDPAVFFGFLWAMSITDGLSGLEPLIPYLVGSAFSFLLGLNALILLRKFRDRVEEVEGEIKTNPLYKGDLKSIAVPVADADEEDEDEEDDLDDYDDDDYALITSSKRRRV